MSEPDHSLMQPVKLPERDDRGRRQEASVVGTPLRVLLLCLGSLVLMAPWPMLGILLMRPSFEEPSEAFFMFGGITLFPLMILALFGPVPEEVLIVLIMLVWLAAAAVPVLWLRRRLRSSLAIGVLLAAQSAFAFAQAVMGALLIVGKNI